MPLRRRQLRPLERAVALAGLVCAALLMSIAGGCGPRSQGAVGPAPTSTTARNAADFPTSMPGTVSTGGSTERQISAAGAPTSGPVFSTTTTLLKPTAERPLVVWVAGDSMIAETGSALVKAGERLRVMRFTVRVRDCSGLCRPDFFDWPALMKTDMARFRPDAVVVMFGGNDVQDIRGSGLEIGVFTDEWKAEYARRVGEAMDILSRGGSRVFWIAAPIMRDEELSREAGILNAIYAKEAQARDSVTYLDAYRLFAGPEGTYQERLPDASGVGRLVREPDGVHLTALGGERMAVEVLRLMRKYWDLPSG